MGRYKSDLVDIDAELVHETELAYKICTDDARPDETTVWVPKRSVEWDGKTTFTMPQRLAEEKGLV